MTMTMIVKEKRESAISVLGEDLLVEIVRRLGCVKSATRCKSVCKLWCSLINTGAYWLCRWCEMNHKKQSVTLITEHREGIEITIDCCSKETPTVWVNFDFLPCFNGKNSVHVLSSHKDLLLCCSRRDQSSGYYICNPFTKQWTALPPPPPLLGWQTNVRTHAEFIVDERAGKFTVVRIFPFLSSPEEKAQVSIFSSDGGWREMDDGGAWREMFLAKRSCRKVVSYKGRLVFHMRKAFADEVRLYSFDLHFNCSRLPPIPPAHPNYRLSSTFTIGVCEGHLRIAQMLDHCEKLIVWQFDDSQRQAWHMLQELDLSRLGKESRDWSTTISLHEREQGFIISVGRIAFHPHDGDILYMYVSVNSDDREGSSSIFMCNLKRRRLELMRKTPLYEWRATFLPLVVRCWPTPVPRLQP